MKKQVALILAGTAAVIAGYLRLIQDLIDRGEGSGFTSDGKPEQEGQPASADRRESGSTTVSSSASKAELYEIATKLEINGRSKMSKAELIDAINRAG